MCGAINPEGAEVCQQCGARLKPLTSAAAAETTGAPEAAEDFSDLFALRPKAPPPEGETPAEERPSEEVPVFPEEVIEKIPEEEIPDILADLRAKIGEAPPEVEEKPPEEAPVPPEEAQVEIPSWLLEEEAPAEGPAEAVEEFPAPPEAPRAEEAPPAFEEKPPVAERPEEAEAFKLPEEEVPEWLLEELEPEKPEKPAPPPPEIEKPAEEGAPAVPEEPEWLKEVEAAKPLEGAPPPEEWLKEVKLPWLEEEEEAPVMAEIPPWLEALRPPEAEEKAALAERAEALEEEKEGLLAGLKGLLKPAEALLPPEELPLHREEEVRTPKELVRTLAQLASTRAVPPPLKVPAIPRPRFGYAVLYLLLLAAVVVPLLLGWSPIPAGYEGTSPEVEKAYSTVQNLPAGAKVLVAFDYEPYTAGEMDVVAKAVFRHLKARGARVAVLSLNPTGPALAQQIWQEVAGGGYTYGRDFLNLGFLPGREASLRALSRELPRLIPYDYARGEPIGSFPLMKEVAEAGRWDLVVVLSGEPADLIWWIEQVGTVTSAPFVAGVSAGIKPYAMAYFQSGQLAGVVGGIPDAAHYEEIAKTPSTASEMAPAQALAVLVVLFVILVGSIFGGKR